VDYHKWTLPPLYAFTFVVYSAHTLHKRMCETSDSKRGHSLKLCRAVSHVTLGSSFIAEYY